MKAIQPLSNSAIANQAEEREYFDPAAIQAVLDRNIVTGLRMLADAIEVGHLEGRCIDVMGNGFFNNRDRKAHLMVRLDIAADYYKSVPYNRHQLPVEEA